MNDNTESKTLWMFVPSTHDDYGLDPYEYRVYARIARRTGSDGDCWESVTSIAAGCLMSRRKAAQCLRVLELCKMIKGTQRQHNTTVYKVTPHSEWIDKTLVTQIRESVQKNSKKQGTAPESQDTAQDAVLHEGNSQATEGNKPTAQGAVPHAQGADKGHPFKLIPQGLTPNQLGNIPKDEDSTRVRNLETISHTGKECDGMSEESTIRHTPHLDLIGITNTVMAGLKQLSPESKPLPYLKSLIKDNPEKSLEVFNDLVESGCFMGVDKPIAYFSKCLQKCLGVNDTQPSKPEQNPPQAEIPATEATFQPVEQPAPEIEIVSEPQPNPKRQFKSSFAQRFFERKPTQTEGLPDEYIPLTDEIVQHIDGSGKSFWLCWKLTTEDGKSYYYRVNNVIFNSHEVLDIHDGFEIKLEDLFIIHNWQQTLTRK